MDKLKSILAAKKPTTKVVIQQEEIEKKKAEYYEKQKIHKQEEEQLTKKRFKELDQFYGEAGKKKIKTQDSQKLQIPLTNQQIKTQLQKLYQEDRYEGELDENRYIFDNSRYKRLLRMQKIHHDYPQIDMKTFDEKFFRIFKEKEYFESLDSKHRQKMIEPKLADDSVFREKKLKMILSEKQKDLQSQQNFAQVCDSIYIWIVKILRDWKERLDQKYSSEENKKSNESLQKYHQTQHELYGLLKVLKNKTGDKQMIVSMYHIINCCLVREYVQANDKYLDLSIGKAPWPMGVAMLGITVKKNAQRLSHVLNDEITRKWVQGLKRLITVSQELYPNEDQTKMVFLSVNSML